MLESYFHDETFERADALQKGEYEHCTFSNCNFSEHDLSGFRFVDCLFVGCNMSLANLNKTAIRDVVFKECKLLGLRFDRCDSFGLSFSFDGCQLNHSAFSKTKIKKMHFRNSQLQGVDFSETDLSGAVFEYCDLLDAVFDFSVLEGTDFRTAYNYSIDPQTNKIKKAKFSMDGIKGLLDKFDIRIED